MSANATSQTTILVLGGTGTVGSRIVQQLSSHPNHPTVLVASRKGQPEQQHNRNDPGLHHVSFDWHNTDTWSNPFTSAPAGQISAIYLIAPPSLDAEFLMNQFVDFARERGVRRFVLQSASSVEAGGPAMGKVHAYLRDLGQEGKVDWAVLRPTWFQRMCFLLCPLSSPKQD